MWKDIQNFEERYQISDNGEVRNKNTNNILKLKVDRDGYHQIGIRKSRERKKYMFSVHRLVACHFLEKIESYETLQVDHIDHNKLNNNVINLRWVTCVENNLNRQLIPWSTNATTNELYITKYKHGYMIRINRSDYKKSIWEPNLELAIEKRNACLKDIEMLALVR